MTIKPTYLTAKFIADFEKKVRALTRLDSECKSRIIKRLKKPTNIMFERMFAAGLCDRQKNYYIGLTDRVNRTDKNHEHIESLTTNNQPDEYQGKSPYFNNAIKFAGQANLPPSGRITNCGFYIHTYEEDKAVKINGQIHWVLGNPELNSVVGKIYQELSKYKDFRGLYCVFSGNKSLHIHVEWSLKHLARNKFKPQSPSPNHYKDIPDEYLRKGLQYYWEELRKEVAGIIFQKTQQQVPFDNAVQPPEFYRRLSWGIRVAKSGELFPIGTKVPQIELWARTKSKATGKETKGYFHKRKKFRELFKAKVISNNHMIADPAQLPQLPPKRTKAIKEFIKYVAEVTMNNVGNYPKPVDAVHCNEGIKISFQNNAADKNPSSFMKGNYRHIKIVGAAPGLPKTIALPFSANDLWMKFNDVYVEKLFPERPLLPILEKWFGIFKKKGITSVYDILGYVLPKIISLSKRAIILAPEGAGKTTALLKSIPQFEDISRGNVAVVSASYEQAQSHCDDFNSLTQSDPALKNYIGVLLPSLSRLYQQYSSAKKYTSADAYRAAGYSTLLEAVYKNEPDTAKELEQWKKDFFDDIKNQNKVAVYFSTHHLIHNWNREMTTRAWLNTPNNTFNLTHVIYDELKRQDLRTQHKPKWVDFANEVKIASKGRSNQYSTYQRLKSGAPKGFTLSDLFTILDIGYGQEHYVHAEWKNEPLLIARTQTSKWHIDKHLYVKERNWWKLPKKGKDGKTPETFNLIILTTERSLFEIMAAINKKTKQPFALVDFEYKFPLPVGSNIAKRHTIGGINATEVRDFADNFFKTHSSADWQFISNNCNNPRIGNTISHHTARGQNSFKDKNIASTYMYPNPTLYAQLLADNAYFGLQHGVKAHVLDELNQTLGRNLGNRFSNKEHHIYMTPMFAYDFLLFLRNNSRYDID